MTWSVFTRLFSIFSPFQNSCDLLTLGLSPWGGVSGQHRLRWGSAGVPWDVTAAGAMNSPGMQGGEVQRSRAFHCGIFKLTINLILIKLEFFFLTSK